MNNRELRIAQAILDGYVPFAAHPTSKDSATDKAPDDMFADFGVLGVPCVGEMNDDTRLRFVKGEYVVEIDPYDTPTVKCFNSSISTQYGRLYSAEPRATLCAYLDVVNMVKAHILREPKVADPEHDDIPDFVLLHSSTALNPILAKLDRAVTLMKDVWHARVGKRKYDFNPPFHHIPVHLNSDADNEDLERGTFSAVESVKDAGKNRITTLPVIIRASCIISAFHAPASEYPARSIIKIVGETPNRIPVDESLKDICRLITENCL